MSHEMQTANFQWMKSVNKSTILNVIRLHGPISRAEIAKRTKLTPPTVTNMVAELLESRLVIECERGKSSGGRKPILLTINSKAFSVIGVYAGPKQVRAVLAALDGEILFRTEAGYPSLPSAAEFLTLLIQTVQEVIAQAKASVQTVLGIGVGVHGLVDPVRGISVYAPHLQLRQVAVKDALEEAFSLPVEVENDVRALALAEGWFGRGKGYSHYICMHVGTGVGAGIVLDNRLFHGTSYTAGEVGHTTVDPNGPVCTCGNAGCLETLASGPAIAARARALMEAGRPSLLTGWIGNQPERLTGPLLHQAAEAGDELAVEVLAEAGRYLGICVANLINLFNPSRIILAGGVAGAGRFVLDPLRETAVARALQVPARAVSIVTSELGPSYMELGAVTLVLHKMFTPTGVSSA